MKTATLWVILTALLGACAAAQSIPLPHHGFISDSVRKKAGLRANLSAPDYSFVPWLCSRGWGAFASFDRIDIPAEFDSLGQFHSGFAVVSFAGKHGLLDKSGAIVLPVQYDAVQSPAERRAAIAKSGKWGVFLKKGAITVLKYDTACSFRNGMAKVRRNRLWGFVNLSGNESVPCRYQAVGDFSASGLAAVKYAGKWGLISKTGAFRIPLQFSAASEFSEGLAAVATGDSTGFIDANGKWVVPPEYQDGLPFSGGLAFVKSQRKWGAINRNRGIALPFVYDESRQFSGRIGFARRDTARFAITTSCITTFLPNIEKVMPFRQGLAIVKFKGKWGVLDTTLRLALQPVYDTIYSVEHRATLVRRGNETLYVSITGNIVGNECRCITEPKFDSDNQLFNDAAADAVRRQTAAIYSRHRTYEATL